MTKWTWAPCVTMTDCGFSFKAEMVSPPPPFPSVSFVMGQTQVQQRTRVKCWICSPAIKLGESGCVGDGAGCDLGRDWISCNPQGESTVSSLTHSWAWSRPAGSGGKATHTHTHHERVTVGPSNPKLNMKSFVAKLEDKQNHLLLNHTITKDFFSPVACIHKNKVNNVKKMEVTTHKN